MLHKIKEKWHPSYDTKSSLQSFGKSSCKCGMIKEKCKGLLKDARKIYAYFR